LAGTQRCAGRCGIGTRGCLQVVVDRESAHNVGMSELAALLELLHDADRSFHTFRARYRIWRDHPRADATFLNASGPRVRRFITEGENGQRAAEHSVCLWRATPNRARVEYVGAERDGAYGIRVGDRWWSWDPRVGPLSNSDRPDVVSGIGHELGSLLDPTLLLAALRFHPGTRGRWADRPTLVVDATPRPEVESGPRRYSALHDLGIGAERYTFSFDAERGLVLAAQAFAGDECFQSVEALDVAFDEALDESLFRFSTPG
jgi:hypothetical protein